MKGVIPMYDENETVHCDTASSAVCESPSSDDDIIELHDEDGNPLIFKVERYFHYNKDEFVVLVPRTTEAESPEEAREDIYIMKVDVEMEDNEEMEVFSPIEDDDLYEALVQIATTKMVIS